MQKNPYATKPYTILSIEKETLIDYTYKFKTSEPLIGGQFMEISIPGIGEAPISISSFDEEGMFMTIRRVGKLTDQLFELGVGDNVYMRGPYGNGFTMDNFINQEVLVIAGGTGLAPVKHTIESLLRSSKQLPQILLGFKTPMDILFKADIEKWSKETTVCVTVDEPTEAWQGATGLITTHLTDLNLENIENKMAIVVGPPIMMKFMTLTLLKAGFLEKNIWVSFERKMSCGLGKCGHCKIDETYVCLEGPVFNYTKAKMLMD